MTASNALSLRITRDDHIVTVYGGPAPVRIPDTGSPERLRGAVAAALHAAVDASVDRLLAGVAR